MKESILIAAVIFLAIFFAKFPTLYNWLNTPAGYWYPKNTSWFDAWDTNFQVSDIRYGQRKGLFVQNTYTTIPHKPAFIYQYYTFLGILNRFLHLDPFILYHLATIVTSIFLILVCYFLVRLFFDDPLYRISAFIMMVLGGGLGWVPGLASAADYRIAGFTLVNAFERGHDALSTLLLLLCFSFLYLYYRHTKAKYIIWAVIAGLFSMTVHPPLIAMYIAAALVIAAKQYVEKKGIKLLLLPVILALGFGVYYLTTASNLFSNPGFSGVVGQNIFDVDTLSLVLGFGLLSPFIFWSLVGSDEKHPQLFFLKSVFLVQLLFIFLPFGFHLYFVKGIFMWGVLLGIYGIRSLITNIRLQRIVLTLVVAVSIFTRLIIFANLVDAKINNPFFFLTKGEGDALSFMSGLPADSAVLSLYRIGNYIPAHTDTRVYYGHKFQTPNSAETLRRAQLFYTSMDEEEQRKFLADNNINYIYYGWEEANLRKDNKLNPVNPFPYFPALFSNDSSIIYSVHPPQK